MQPMSKDGDPVTVLAITNDEVEFYSEEGYLVLPGLLAPKSVQDLRSETLELIETERPPHAKLQQTSRIFTEGFIDKLVLSENLRVLTSRLVGGESTLHNPFTAVKAAGGGRFHFHQDNQYTAFEGPGINVWFALQDITPENGALQIVPRSHQKGITYDPVPSGDGDEYLKVDWEPEYFLPVRLHAGDAVAFDRLLVHGSGENRTSEPRVGYGVQFFRNDTKAIVDGKWKLLKEHPKFQLQRISR